MAARESLASQGRRREPERQPPGVLHISRDPWGCLEVALRAPWDYRRITVRLPLTIARCPSDFPLIMTFKIVWEPSGYPTVPLRAFYGLLRVVYGLSAVVRSHENAGKIGSSLLSTPAPACTTSKNCPGALENRRAPYGYRTEMAKITVFTRRTGPLKPLSHYAEFGPRVVASYNAPQLFRCRIGLEPMSLHVAEMSLHVASTRQAATRILNGLKLSCEFSSRTQLEDMSRGLSPKLEHVWYTCLHLSPLLVMWKVVRHATSLPASLHDKNTISARHAARLHDFSSTSVRVCTCSVRHVLDIAASYGELWRSYKRGCSFVFQDKYSGSLSPLSMASFNSQELNNCASDADPLAPTSTHRNL